MEIILITGNGFDLHFGLPTKYKHFIEISKHLIENSVNLSLKERFTFDEIYLKCDNYKDINDTYNSFEFNSEELKAYANELKNNLWFKHFSKKNEIDTWIDFENEISVIIEKLVNTIIIYNENSKELDSKEYFDIEKINNDIHALSILETFDFFDDYDEGCINSIFFHKVEYKDGMYLTEISLEKVFDKLRVELGDFKKVFKKYFEIFVIPLYNNLKNKEIIDIRFDKHFTFNYTPTFEIFFGRINTEYLHGSILKSKDIVLGVNEIFNNLNISKKILSPFTKYYQKLVNDTDYKFLHTFNKDAYKRYAICFVFWGHSLDISDKNYINEVIDFVSYDKGIWGEKKSIYIVYHDEISKSNLLLNLLNNRGNNDIENLMKSEKLVFVKNDYTLISNKITNFINTNISSADIPKVF